VRWWKTSGIPKKAWIPLAPTHNKIQSGEITFLDSSDKIHYFAEPAASVKVDRSPSSRQLRDSYLTHKITALNKAGHGMHVPPQQPFHDYTCSPKVRALVTYFLGWKDPVVPQSMYIFKQAATGGAVHSHQDSTFLYTTPVQSCVGLWLALDDATLDNGCLWLRPKSHNEPVRRQYIRNPVHFDKNNNNNTDKTDAPKFIMNDLYQQHDVTWDGELPDDLRAAGFIPVPCKAGDLLVFNGELDHLSLPNYSNAPRHTFQLHLVEGQGVTWSPDNWLQYPDGKSFLRLFDEKQQESSKES
jgi:phytanoyl-CoA hydroxylase